MNLKNFVFHIPSCLHLFAVALFFCFSNLEYLYHLEYLNLNVKYHEIDHKFVHD